MTSTVEWVLWNETGNMRVEDSLAAASADFAEFNARHISCTNIVSRNLNY
jgi:hypothetical protein